MNSPANFDIWVDDDRIRVRFVPQKQLGRLSSGHLVGGDFGDGIIRLPRFDTRRAQRAVLFHEMGHYLVKRQELRARDTTEEEVCDLLAWVPPILADERNADLRAFLGL
jgi:hypothetical protein